MSRTAATCLCRIGLDKAGAHTYASPKPVRRQTLAEPTDEVGTGSPREPGGMADLGFSGTRFGEAPQSNHLFEYRVFCLSLYEFK